MELVGYSFVLEKPFSPDFLVVRDSFILLKIAPNQAPSEVSLINLIANGQAVKLDPPLIYQKNQWMIMEEDGPRLIPLLDLDQWKSRKAKETLQSVNHASDPERKVELIRASARLAGINLEPLLRKLEILRIAPEERLDQLFNKLKNT